MNIMVFDTETTSLDKPFCYNIGYCIYDTDNEEIIVHEDYVVEQIWHNMELFSTAYYAEKRPLYVADMRAKLTKMDKFGYITQRMCRLIKTHEVVAAYAYNSPFDERVMNFNCDWFKCINPFDNIPIYDIRGYVHKEIAFDPDFQNFATEHELFTETGAFSTSAENIFKYITKNTEYQEAHTALADSIDELYILLDCIGRGAEFNKVYKVYSTIKRGLPKTLTIRNSTLQTDIFSKDYESIRVYKNSDGVKITVKEFDE